MRDYKFRGKRVDGEEWVYGSLVIDKDGLCEIVDYSDHENDTYTWQRVIPETVGQYIGVKVKNKEVYEGDRLKTWYSRDTSGTDIVPVEYNVEYEVELSIDSIGYDLPFLQNAEVIGNIHDNPEYKINYE